MSDAVRQIAQAVLYEGYLLWPYRRSAPKNRHRFTIGGLYPEIYAAHSADRARARFSVLVEGRAPSFDLEVRFLHLVRRQAYRDGRPVDALTVGETRHLSWDEAAEDVVALGAPLPIDVAIVREARCDEEPLGPAAALRRTRERLEGRVTANAVRAGDDVLRLTVDVANESRWDGLQRDEALRRTFAAAHVVVRVRDGAFVSPLDDPDRLVRGLVAGARRRSRRARRRARGPVILGDYPAVAPESPGDLFDGGEIDELLIHNIRALTDEEQREMRDTDARAREILERSLALDPDRLRLLHGTFRDG